LKEPVEQAERDDPQNKYKIIDDDNLSTFKSLYARMSMRVNKTKAALIDDKHNTTAQSYLSPSDPSKRHNAPLAAGSSSGKTLTANINYSNKPLYDLNNHFKCFILAKGGKKCRKKSSVTYMVGLKITTLMFVNEKDPKSPKLEVKIDIKGGRCVKIDNRAARKASDAASNNKDTLSMTEKERAELQDLIGSSKHAFIVSLLLLKFDYSCN
jgi:hypothetical protein